MIYINLEKTTCETHRISKFPGGEIFIRYTEEIVSLSDIPTVYHLTKRLNNSDDIMLLFNAIDAIKRINNENKIEVVIPYIPYARQDRVCNPGESHALKVFCDMLNSYNLDKVTCYDPHSIVCESLINNLCVISCAVILQNSGMDFLSDISDIVLVSPDAGALKKIYDVAKLGFTDIAVGNKVRDLSTGDIIRSDIDRQDFGGKDVFIVDDICDGGRTFIELAKVMRKRNCGKIYLYVTHGIFSKGEDVLFEHIDHIVTTNSISDTTTSDNKTIIEIINK